MKLYLRGKVWWIQYQGKRISTQHTDETAARLWANAYERRGLVLDAIKADPELADQVETYLASRRNANGYVYGIQCGNRVKIGFTRNQPNERVRQVATHAGETPALVALARGTRETEGQAHALLASARIKGEWFEASSRSVQLWVEANRYSSGTITRSAMVVPRALRSQNTSEGDK